MKRRWTEWAAFAAAAVVLVTLGYRLGAAGVSGGIRGQGLGPGRPGSSLAPLVRRVASSVVNIYTTRVVPDRSGWFFGGAPWFDGSMRTSRSLGTGFVISKRGEVLTNAHVVRNAADIKVRLSDGRVYEAELVGSSRGIDLALLRMREAKRLRPAVLGNSDKLRVGDWVVAVGNPFGLSHTVTQGIVSAKERTVRLVRGALDDFIQTDAAINPGNSGGPLFDLRGRVVGINTAIKKQAQGIGFALPINLCRLLLPRLRAGGRIARGWLGVGLAAVDARIARRLKLDRAHGVLIVHVHRDSPAAQAGLGPGDVVLGVGGRPVRSVSHLVRRVALVVPGKTVRLELYRGGAKLSKRVRVGRMPMAAW